MRCGGPFVASGDGEPFSFLPALWLSGHSLFFPDRVIAMSVSTVQRYNIFHPLSRPDGGRNGGSMLKVFFNKEISKLKCCFHALLYFCCREVVGILSTADFLEN